VTSSGFAKGSAAAGPLRGDASPATVRSIRPTTDESRIDPLNPTIYHEPWWLEAASGGASEEVSVALDGKTVGRLPFLRKRRLGMEACELPHLTHFLGPAIDEGNGNAATRARRRAWIMRELIARLPKVARFSQQFHRGVADTLPFLNEGFSTDAMFTYELRPASEETLWRGLRDKTRNVIRRAREQTVVVDLEPEEFDRVYEANLRARGLVNHRYGRETGPAVFRAALDRDRGRLIGARDRNGSVIAAIFYAWDDVASYYVLTTRSPDSHNGAVSFLMWEAIRDSAAHGRIFDFDGVGSAGTSQLYPSFGGDVRPRYHVHRTTPAYAAARICLMRARDMAHSLQSLATGRGASAAKAE
jgi:hypothetical protein